MKKSLVALAALAVVGMASAQSSVTMYGVADLSLSDTNAAGSTAQMSGNGTMNNGSSRLGVRGTEDLGGGLKASFNFEQGINAETGNTDGLATTCVAAVAPATAPTCTTSAATFQRAANLSLAGNFGTVRMGRTLTPAFYGIAAWEITGTANYSAVGSQFGYIGGARNNSEFSYTTPDISGFSAALGYVFKADNAGNAEANANVKYVQGPIALGLSYNKTQNSDKEWALGGKYTMGNFQVAASFHDPIGAKKGFSIGGSAVLGPVVLTLDVARDTGSAVETTDTVLEAKYALSKRTFAYAAFLRDDKTAGDTVNNYGLGIRHNF